MPHSRDHALRLMRELEPSLPDSAEVVLERPKYWDEGFGQLFFDYLEDLIFHEPGAGLKVAKVARRLAYAIPAEEHPEGQQAARERLVKAYGLLGTAYRAVGRFSKAAQKYRKARYFCAKGVSGSCREELGLRQAFLHAFQKRFDEALKLIDRAERYFVEANDNQWLGRTLATRGAVLILACRFPEAVTALSQALANCRLTQRVEYSVTGNLAYAVSESDDQGCFEVALEHMRRARRLCGPRRSVQKSIFYWIEGRIFVRRGSTERAEQKYRKALQGFIKFQTPYEIALVSLDISSLLRFSKRWIELEELAAETYHRFRDLQEDTEALASLKLWLDAAQERTLSIEQISEIKAAFVERMRGQGAPGRGRRRQQRS